MNFSERDCGKFKEDLKRLSTATLTDMEEKLHICYSSDSVGLQSFVEIQGGHAVD
jgi:hypothetical protein